MTARRILRPGLMPFNFRLHIFMEPNSITIRSLRPMLGAPSSEHFLLPNEEALAGLNSHHDNLRSTSTFEPGAMIDGALVGVPGKLFVEACATTLTKDENSLGSGHWCDRGVWMFNIQQNGRLLPAFNRTIYTEATKQHKQTVYFEAESYGAMTVCVPFASDDFTTSHIFVKTNRDLGVTHNLPGLVEYDVPTMGFTNDYTAHFGSEFWPRLRLSGPEQIAAGAFGQFTVELLHPDEDTLLTDVSPTVFLESTAGYLVHQRAVIENGVAVFSVGALGMEPGETIKLKAGWRHFTGLAEKEINVA